MQTASLLLSKSEFSPAITPSQVRKAAVNNGLDESATIGEFIAELE
ncbi:flagella cluster protein [Natrialba asiatica DSM 12278]|uniref:Flagella cluster protein n=2 Tax=Natrialba asiatica TaxID=64602 RepID=M0ALU5_NATA1|nr:flagella cluster protein [Natrialba asiatica DSM 12278]